MNEAVFEIRRLNLRRLVAEKFESNRASFSRAAGVHQNQTNLLLTDNLDHRRNLGEALARKIEGALGLSVGWFDVDHPVGVEASITIKTAAVPEALLHIFRRADHLAGIEVYDGLLQHLAGKIASRDSLVLYTLSSHDMEPEIRHGAHVIADTSIKAVTVDGVYVLARGQDLFIRRVTRQLSGGWLIKGAGETLTVDSLKGLRAVAGVVCVLDLRLL